MAFPEDVVRDLVSLRVVECHSHSVACDVIVLYCVAEASLEGESNVVAFSPPFLRASIQ